MISISTILASTGGNIRFRDQKGETSWGADTRRVSRVATLDGGVVIVDSGYTVGDKSLRIAADLNKTDAVFLRNMAAGNTLLILSCERGIFKGVIHWFEDRTGRVKITFMIKEAVDE